MRKPKKLGLLITFLITISLVLMVNTAYPEEALAEMSFVTYPICTASGAQGSPAISRDKVVWSDYRSGSGDIYMYDLSLDSDGDGVPNYCDGDRPSPDPAEIPICTNAANQVAPAISGDRIVWQDHRNGSPDIYMYDISAGLETRITIDPYAQWFPDISGDKIVWTDWRHSGTEIIGGMDIYMYDLSTGAETRIVTDSSYRWEGFPAISGDKIVWYDMHTGNNEIYVYDSSTGLKSQITSDVSLQIRPDISGDKIVWADPWLDVYDLSTSTETTLHTETPGWSPAISGEKIVYIGSGSQGFDTDVYMYDLAASTENRVTSDSAYQEVADISGDRIVWQNGSGQDADIYMATTAQTTPRKSLYLEYVQLQHRKIDYVNHYLRGIDWEMKRRTSAMGKDIEASWRVETNKGMFEFAFLKGTNWGGGNASIHPPIGYFADPADYWNWTKNLDFYSIELILQGPEGQEIHEFPIPPENGGWVTYTFDGVFGPPFSSEQEFMNYEPYWNTFVLRVSAPPILLSRQDIAANIGLFGSIGANENFAWYSNEKTIRVGNYPAWWEWAYVNNGTVDWVRLSWLFEQDVTLHVYEYDGIFISRACGNYSHEMTNPPPPLVSGCKWEDADNDGKWDAGEAARSGWEIILSEGGQEIARTTTNDQGYYQFVLDARPKPEGLGVTPGTFTLSEALKPGWKNTSAPGPVEVLPGIPGRNYADNNFGNFKLGKISAKKYEDLDGDGNKDPEDEEIINEFRVKLDDGDWQNMPYTFENVEPGIHKVTEEVRDGWKPTSPTSYDVEIKTSGQEETVEFLNFKLGKISGYKWDDMLPDGQRADDEKGLRGWTIVLVKPDGTWKTTATEEDGSYEFKDLDCGYYTVWEVLKDHWRQTEPFPDEQQVSSDPSFGRGYHQVYIESGTDAKGRNFGNVELGSITKTVFHYWWHEPIENVPVTLEEIDVPGIINNVPSLPRHGYTNNLGEVLFEGLLPGTYRLTIQLSDGWYPASSTTTDIIELQEGDDFIANNFVYYHVDPRTLGFWKNWRNKHTEAEMATFIERVKEGSQDFGGLSLENIDEMLNPSGPKTTEEMARIQYLVLWLNLASDRLGFNSKVDLTSIADWSEIIQDDDGVLSIQELMYQMRDGYNKGGLDKGQWDVFKNICDAINNFEIILEPKPIEEE